MQDDIVIIGRIGAPFGVKGWVKLQSYTQPEENIFTYQPLMIRRDKQWQNADIIDIQIQHKQAVIQFKDCHDREVAKSYTNCELAVYRHQLPELDDGEYYWHDLIGMTVIHTDDTVFGTVDQIMETGANDVLIIKGDTDMAIPLMFGDVIVDVDLDKKVIRVNWDPDFA